MLKNVFSKVLINFIKVSFNLSSIFAWLGLYIYTIDGHAHVVGSVNGFQAPL